MLEVCNCTCYYSLFSINRGLLFHIQLQPRVTGKHHCPVVVPYWAKTLAMAIRRYSTAVFLLISVFAGTQLQGAAATDRGWEGSHASFYTGSSKTMGTFSKILYLLTLFFLLHDFLFDIRFFTEGGLIWYGEGLSKKLN